MSDDHFLSRWSQRKRRVAEEARKADAAAPIREPAADEAPLDLSLLPDLEALTPETDISLFLQKGVPDALRNAALRKMWALDPAIRDYVGDALDYAWDWNTPGGVPGGGELGAGFDTAKMVAQIFGDDVANKDVIGDVAPPQIPPEDVAPPVARAPDSGEQADLLSEKQGAAAASDMAANPPAPADEIAVPRSRRRHGGASPMAHAKSRMS